MLKNKDDITNVKIIDFGLSKDFTEQKAMQTPSGSVIKILFNSSSLTILHLRSLDLAIMKSVICGQWG